MIHHVTGLVLVIICSKNTGFATDWNNLLVTPESAGCLARMKAIYFICAWSPVPVAASSGEIFQIDPSDHPVQRVCEQRFLSGDETPQRGFQLQRHQQTRMVRTDHLNTHKPRWCSSNTVLYNLSVLSARKTIRIVLCTCRSSSREPPRLISPRGMSGRRLCRKPWISVQMSRARDWARRTSCGASAALVW